MKKLFAAALAAAGLWVGGCASIVKGTTQQVTVNSVPQGAHCKMSRDGKAIAQIHQTPQSVKLSKSWHDIHIACGKQGYRETVAVLNAQTETMTFGNVIVGGLVGLAVDAGTGAMNKYDGSITIPLVHESEPLPKSKPGKPAKPERPVS